MGNDSVNSVLKELRGLPATQEEIDTMREALKAYDRLEYERRTDTSSPNHEKG